MFSLVNRSQSRYYGQLQRNHAHNQHRRETVIETRHLQIFVTVYKTKSFTKAAELLYTSQPTISEHMQNLEARLNCRLFDRLGRSILPTAEAQLLYPRAMAILEDLRLLENDIRTSGNSMTGELLIGASTIPGTYILPGVAAAFKKEFPAISFEIRIKDSAEIVEAVAGNELFIGVVGAKTTSPKLHYQPFAEDELVLAVSGGSQVNPEISMTELCNLPFILRERGSGTRKTIEILLAAQHFRIEQLNVCATLGSSAAVKEAIKAGLGVSVISRHAIRDELLTGAIKEVTVTGLAKQRNFFIVTSAKRTLPHHYQEFCKRLADIPSPQGS